VTRLALRPPRATAALALAVLGLLVVVALAGHGALHGSLAGHAGQQTLARTGVRTTPLPPVHAGRPGGTVHVPGWLLYAGLAIVAAAVVALVVAFVRVRGPARRGVAVASPAQGTAAATDPDEAAARAQGRLREIVDRSLEELRADPNARRAIIGAYHMMERALERAGLPRAPSEAPREYLARALAALQVGPAAPRRLTALFERARFGAGELDLGLRDDAIDALLALREELAR
jgi:Domain of unknown function (DUF4129)